MKIYPTKGEIWVDFSNVPHLVTAVTERWVSTKVKGRRRGYRIGEWQDQMSKLEIDL